MGPDLVSDAGRTMRVRGCRAEGCVAPVGPFGKTGLPQQQSLDEKDCLFSSSTGVGGDVLVLREEREEEVV